MATGITVNTKGFRDAAGRFATASTQVTQRAGEAMRDLRDSVIAIMRAEAPKKTGKLAASITGRVDILDKGVKLRVGPSPRISYLNFVLFGTKPHEIYPVHKRALWWEGAEHPVAHVYHPGTKANDFIVRALNRAKPEIEVTAGRISAMVASITASGGKR